MGRAAITARRALIRHPHLPPPAIRALARRRACPAATGTVLPRLFPVSAPRARPARGGLRPAPSPPPSSCCSAGRPRRRMTKAARATCIWWTRCFNGCGTGVRTRRRAMPCPALKRRARLRLHWTPATTGEVRRRSPWIVWRRKPRSMGPDSAAAIHPRQHAKLYDGPPGARASVSNTT